MATVSSLFNPSTVNPRMAEMAQPAPKTAPVSAKPTVAPAVTEPAVAAPAAATPTDSGGADSLYIDPTPTYQPTLDFLKKQTAAANQRYATNKADIKNIFGNLTTVSEKDAARIEDQFVKSIQEQQAGLAQRTAEVRNQQGTARQAMQAVGAERGGGPVGAGPTAVDRVAEEGIARSNEYQTTWEALMRANAQQAQENLRNRITGFGQQQASALTALQQNLEARLAEIGGNTAAVQSDIAKAKLAGQQNVADAKYRERLANQQAAASAATATSKPTSYPKNRIGWAREIDDLAGPGVSQTIMDAVDATIRDLQKPKSSSQAQTNDLFKINPKSAVMQAWRQKYGNTPALQYALEYIDKYAGLQENAILGANATY